MTKGPFWLALATLLIITGWTEYHILQSTNGVISFPMDETFTRLAVAKNLAFHEVWGISQHQFSSASSTLLYPIILAIIFFIFGAYPIIAILVNVAAAILLLFLTQRWLAQQGLSFIAQTCILLALILLTPLPVIVISGMEHTLQLLLSFCFITRFYHDYTTGKLSKQTHRYGALLIANRYESIILIVAACIALIIKRKRRDALKLGLYSLLPILIFGIISIKKGSYFIPNPILLRSNNPIGIVTDLYLAWFIGNSVIIGGTLLVKYGQSLLKKVVVLFLFLLLSLHSVNAFQRINQSCIDFYRQPYQAGKLLQRYYKWTPVALDNLGVASFLTDTKEVDLLGQANPVIIKKKNDHRYDAHLLDSLNTNDGIAVAICYDKNMFPDILRHWKKMATWTIPNSIICKDSTLSIYIVDAVGQKDLEKYIHAFQPHLPPGVSVRYY